MAKAILFSEWEGVCVALLKPLEVAGEELKQWIRMKHSKSVNLRTAVFRTFLKVCGVKKRTASSSPQVLFEEVVGKKG
jgi:hypothetical protein